MLTNPERTAALLAIREELKAWASRQVALKAASQIPSENITAEMRQKLELGTWACPSAQRYINRCRITALLNFYLAARRKEYRHSTLSFSKGRYEHEMQQLHKRFPVLTEVAGAPTAQ